MDEPQPFDGKLMKELAQIKESAELDVIRTAGKLDASIEGIRYKSGVLEGVRLVISHLQNRK